MFPECLAFIVGRMGSSFKPREERKALILSARMLAGQGWREVTVRNVSSRGMMLRCEAPPARNTVVEIRHHKACVVGRVVWLSETAFGITSQDTIDLAKLLSQSPAPPAKASEERRSHPRDSGRQSVQMRVLPAEEASKIFARLFDWSAVAIAVAFGAVAVAEVAKDALEKPFEKTRVALSAQKSN